MAEQYDRYRPTSPDALLDRLAALRPADVLDVACGTGKTAAALAARGLRVLGVELDPRMARVASAHGVTVEISPFETWPDAGRRFDLITCTSGWHWIDPQRGLRKAAELLRPGGVIARFWNYYRLDESTQAALAEVYRRHAPGTRPHASGARNGAPPVDPFATDAAFNGVERALYRWDQVFTADEWAGLVATYSDHQQLAPERLAALQAAVRDLIQARGGTLHAQGECHLLLSHRTAA